MEQVEKISKLEMKVENIEDTVGNVKKQVESLDEKVEAGHIETEKQIGRLTSVVEKFIATQTVTNEITNKYIDEIKISREKQDAKIDSKLEKMDGEIKSLRETVLKNKYELQLGDKEQDLSHANEKFHLSWGTLKWLIPTLAAIGAVVVSIVK